MAKRDYYDVLGVNKSASPEQLNCFGIPLPGDSFWNNNTIRLANLRYPGWDMAEYKEKMVTYK